MLLQQKHINLLCLLLQQHLMLHLEVLNLYLHFYLSIYLLYYLPMFHQLPLILEHLQHQDQVIFSTYHHPNAKMTH